MPTGKNLDASKKRTTRYAQFLRFQLLCSKSWWKVHAPLSKTIHKNFVQINTGIASLLGSYLSGIHMPESGCAHIFLQTRAFINLDIWAQSVTRSDLVNANFQLAWTHSAVCCFFSMNLGFTPISTLIPDMICVTNCHGSVLFQKQNPNPKPVWRTDFC